MIAVDSSVVVAAFASWHEGHTSAVAVLARSPRIPAHAGATLVTRDHRARVTYDRLHVPYEFVS
ncbi:MAG: type II toxin-antitoxin system VapC family toxin [Acidimicrobiia bacterium]|nr:type II toxin-antitoxin system VapC family toxin [Acidimicrobiia bacterium]